MQRVHNSVGSCRQGIWKRGLQEGIDDLLEIIWHRVSSQQGLYPGWSSFDKQQGCAMRCAVLSPGHNARPHQARLKVKALQHLKRPKSSWSTRMGIVLQGQGYCITPLHACNAVIHPLLILTHLSALRHRLVRKTSTEHEAICHTMLHYTE